MNTPKTESRTHSADPHVFVTGISGYLGSAVAEGLLAAGYRVSGLVRHSSRTSPELEALKGRIEIYTGDMCDFSAMRQILVAAAPTHIIHFAAMSSVSASFQIPIETSHNNYCGNVSFAEAARQACPSLKMFAFSSSMETYGFQPEGVEVFTEDMKRSPRAPYAVAKLAFEAYLTMLCANYGFPAVSVLQTNSYGRLSNPYFIVEQVISQMIKSPKQINLGDPRPVRNFIHSSDLVALYVQMVKSVEAGNTKLFGQSFNTGPDNGVTIEDLAKIIAEEVGFHGKINWYTREKRAGEVFRLNSSNEKIKKVLNWEPKVELREGIARTVKFWRAKIKAEKK